MKPTNDPKDMGRQIEKAIYYGKSVLLEDAQEIIDPMFDSILERQIDMQG